MSEVHIENPLQIAYKKAKIYVEKQKLVDAYTSQIQNLIESRGILQEDMKELYDSIPADLIAAAEEDTKPPAYETSDL